MNHPEPDPLSPPPFAFYEDHEFAANMAMIVPDERVRDDVVNSIGWQITHTLVGTATPEGIVTLAGSGHNLIITQKLTICPSLRVVYSVRDEPPTRRINLHRASLRDQNGSSGS